MNAVSHAPAGYLCPFCALLVGQEHESVWSVPGDVVYRAEGVTALIAAGGPKFNPGHVLVIPDAHCENLYDLPEQDGNQDVWHLHLHVFPRFSGDALYDQAQILRSTPAERQPYAEALRQYLQTHPEAFQDSERTIP